MPKWPDPMAFKVVHQFGNAENRRFTLPYGTAFGALRTAVARTLGVAEQTIVLKFVDEDSDWCSMTCDEDLTDAVRLAEIEGAPVRLVVLDGPAEPASAPRPAPLLTEADAVRFVAAFAAAEAVKVAVPTGTPPGIRHYIHRIVGAGHPGWTHKSTGDAADHTAERTAQTAVAEAPAEPPPQP